VVSGWWWGFVMVVIVLVGPGGAGDGVGCTTASHLAPAWWSVLAPGRSSVWALAGGRRRVTGPQITVPHGELASDWLSEQEVESSSLREVPLSPSPRSLLWLLQQQSQWEEDHREEEPPADMNTHKHTNVGTHTHTHTHTHKAINIYIMLNGLHLYM